MCIDGRIIPRGSPACACLPTRGTIGVDMDKKEEYWSDIALQVALEKEAKAKAEAAARGEPPPPPIPLDVLVSLTFDALTKSKGVDPSKVDPKQLVENLRLQAGTTYEAAVNLNAQKRHDALFNLQDSRYKRKTPDVAKRTLDDVWNYAAAHDPKLTPESIIHSPDKLQHSAVAMELVTRLTVDQFEPELRDNPKLWFEEVARAYQSIDFKSMTPEAEAEIYEVFTNTFNEMRKMAKKLPEGSIDFPKGNEKLWQSVGDYYFSTSLDESPALDGQRRSLRAQLKNLQADLVRPHIAREEADILKQYRTDLESRMSLYPDLKDDVFKVQHRMTKEIKELTDRPEGAGGRSENTAEARAEAGEKWFKYEEPPGGRGEWSPLGINTAWDAFNYTESDKANYFTVRAKLRSIDELFAHEDPLDRFDGSGRKQARLGSAMRILDDIERSHSSMRVEQREALENLKVQLHAQQEAFYREGEPPNRLYLTKEEQQGLEFDGIGTVERMYIELTKAFAKDPDGPLAKFYLDRMELMQYYLFARQHGKKLANIDVVVVSSREALERAIETKAQFQGNQLTEQEALDLNNRLTANIQAREIDLKQVHESRESDIVKEKSNFERTFINRFHEMLFVQQWKHAASANDEQFQRFVNARMLEDDFWNMDGQFGGLVKYFRETLARKYEAKMFDPNGDRNPHLDRYWDAAIKETAAELKDSEKYSDYKKIWERYINGEFFMENPDTMPGELSTLRRQEEAARRAGASLPPPISYEEACDMITQFASFRMIMSQEKYLMDLRYLPVRWGKEFMEIPEEFFKKDGNALLLPIELRTQFYEKQKIAKLANSFEAWMITWGGITSGMSGEEQFMMRHRAKILQEALPDIAVWGKEWAQDWWENKVRPLQTGKIIVNGIEQSLTPAQKKRFMGEMKSLFSFAADVMDNPSNMTEPEVERWIKGMTQKKLEEETTFYASMRAGAMTQGLTFYMGVSESGARRDAQFGAINELLRIDHTTPAGERIINSWNHRGISDEKWNGMTIEEKAAAWTENRTRQNFLTFVDVGSSRGYFQKKLNTDSFEIQESFLGEKGQSFMARYAPHTRLLALREGDSLAVRDWIDKHGYVGGKKGFAKFYEDLARFHENIRAELALEEQIDYSGKFSDISERQRQAMDLIFRTRNKLTDAAQIRAAEEEYFAHMHDISEFLLNAQEYKKYSKKTPFKFKHGGQELGALSELTDIRYGQILIHMRRDDYLYEYVQNPERALVKLRKQEWHPLYGMTIADVRKDDKLSSRYLTTASDKYEPTSAQDEQSGLWRRNWRDVGAAATWWDMTGDRWSLDQKRFIEALEKTYKMIVGVNGNDIAKIWTELDDGQRLSFQLVNPRYGQWQKWAYNSSDVKKIHPEMESRLSDDLWHQHEVDSHATGGRARYTAPGATGIENALKRVLRVSYWDKWLGSQSLREDFIERVQKSTLLPQWIKNKFERKNMENFMEWLDHTLPQGVVWDKLQVLGAITLLFFIIYTIQAAGSEGEEKKKSH